jgi:pimeloyl-ACP methyl ester carboxylesterase
MNYGAVEPGYLSMNVERVDIPAGDAGSRSMTGVTRAFAEEMGALIINVPNRYYGCETARTGHRAGSCPTSLDHIPVGDEGVLEAHRRLRFLSLTSVVDDIAFVANMTITTFAEDWGMVIPSDSHRAPNRPIVFGCSWPGAAAVYARMKYPELFPGAVATSHPLLSSPDGNPHYRVSTSLAMVP